MPTCAKCGRTDATAEMRRRRPPYTGEWMCKDAPACKERMKQTRAAIRANEIANRKGKK